MVFRIFCRCYKGMVEKRIHLAKSNLEYAAALVMEDL